MNNQTQFNCTKMTYRIIFGITVAAFFCLMISLITAEPARADAPQSTLGGTCKNGYITIVDRKTNEIVVLGVLSFNDVMDKGGESIPFFIVDPKQSYGLQFPATIAVPGSAKSALKHGQCVQVAGTLVTTTAIETGSRQVIKVTSIKPAN
ncbi:MAG: hypothetical protein WC028_23735 [Candidatus Obscuribacterales bacterium]|jgi:hypothetical protein